MSALKPRSFGAHDGLACPKCGGVMYIVRRMPHSDFGLAFERQTFECAKCEKEIERTVDSQGRLCIIEHHASPIGPGPNRLS